MFSNANQNCHGGKSKEIFNSLESRKMWNPPLKDTNINRFRLNVNKNYRMGLGKPISNS